MPFIEYENNILPYSNLPYAFKRRLMQLASLKDASIISIACSELQILNSRRRKSYTTVFITDSHVVSNAAKIDHLKEKDCFLGRYSSSISYYKYIVDGPLTLNPAWNSVLLVDKIVLDNESLHINDTLTLYLSLPDSYDRLMSLVDGSYTRLVLYGQFTWGQVKSLIHANVKQVRIMGNVEVEPKDYDDVIKFVLRFSRGINYKFSFHESCFPLGLSEQLERACKHHKTHSLVICSRKITHFVHKRSNLAYTLYSNFICLVHLLFLIGSILIMLNDSKSQEKPTSLLEAVCNIILYSVVITWCFIPSCLHEKHYYRDQQPFDLDVHQDVMNL